MLSHSWLHDHLARPRLPLRINPGDAAVWFDPGYVYRQQLVKATGQLPEGVHKR